MFTEKSNITMPILWDEKILGRVDKICSDQRYWVDPWQKDQIVHISSKEVTLSRMPQLNKDAPLFYNLHGRNPTDFPLKFILPLNFEIE